MEDQTRPPEEVASHQKVGIAAPTMAWFSSIDQARHAVLALERSGIDSGYIEVARRPTSEDRVLVDKRSMAWMAKLAIAGVLAGMLLGSAIAVLLAVILDAQSGVLAAAAVAGAMFGAFGGGFCLLAVELPVNGAAYDTFGGEPTDSDWVSVSGPAEVIRKANAVLAEMHPIQMSEAA